MAVACRGIGLLFSSFIFGLLCTGCWRGPLLIGNDLNRLPAHVKASATDGVATRVSQGGCVPALGWLTKRTTFGSGLTVCEGLRDNVVQLVVAAHRLIALAP